MIEAILALPAGTGQVPMVHAGLWRLSWPMNELEILSVVVGVAAGAIFIARQRIPNDGVESLVRSHSRGNLRVTLKALQTFAAHGQSMAGDALSGAIERLMRSGKRAGGNLSA